MKRLCMTAALVLLSGTFALAQTSQNSGGVTPNTGGVTNPGTVGAPPQSNPSNSQDISGKSNPQDLTRPGASNRQDLKR